MDLTVFFQMFNFFSAAINDQRTPFNNNSQDLGIKNTTDTSYKNIFWGMLNGMTLNSEMTANYCIENFGCFPRGIPWEGPERPVFLPPQPLDEVNPFFCFHSFLEPDCKKIIVKDNFELTNVDVSQKTHLIVVTHGFLHSTRTSWMWFLVTSLLENLEHNIRVVAIDWSKGGTPPYAQAVSNTRLVGVVVGRLIEKLVIEKELQLTNIHLIGHSLGAHIFGYTGSYIANAFPNKKVGRITGLDPAGPYFTKSPKIVHLDYTDAYFVDIIHTDSTPIVPTLPMSLGLPQASGHLDFFPNGGNLQKGCKKSPFNHIMNQKEIGKGVLEYVGCNHLKAQPYFIASVSNRCQYVGVECDSWESFKHGSCWDCNRRRCFSMGFAINRVYQQTQMVKRRAPADAELHNLIAAGEDKLKLYLVTSNEEELCGEQIRFSLVISNSNRSQEKGADFAKFTVALRGRNGSVETYPREKSVLLSPGDTLSWVDSVPTAIGDIRSVVLTYKEDDQLLHRLVGLTPPTVHLKELVLESLLPDQIKIFKFCHEEIVAGQTVILKQNCK